MEFEEEEEEELRPGTWPDLLLVLHLMSHASLFLIGKFSISSRTGKEANSLGPSPGRIGRVLAGCGMKPERLVPARKFGPAESCDLTTSEFNYATRSEINIIDKPQGQRGQKIDSNGGWQRRVEEGRRGAGAAVRDSRVPKEKEQEEAPEDLPRDGSKNCLMTLSGLLYFFN